MSHYQSIIDLFNAGYSQRRIAGVLRVHRSLVSRTISRFKETGSTEPQPRIGRPRLIQIPLYHLKQKNQVCQHGKEPKSHPE